nr:hypothetical protein [Mycoplasmopsis bovis]
MKMVKEKMNIDMAQYHAKLDGKMTVSSSWSQETLAKNFYIW